MLQSTQKVMVKRTLLIILAAHVIKSCFGQMPLLDLNLPAPSTSMGSSSQSDRQPTSQIENDEVQSASKQTNKRNHDDAFQQQQQPNSLKKSSFLNDDGSCKIHSSKCPHWKDLSDKQRNTERQKKKRLNPEFLTRERVNHLKRYHEITSTEQGRLKMFHLKKKSDDNRISKMTNEERRAEIDRHSQASKASRHRKKQGIPLRHKRTSITKIIRDKSNKQ